ncbi:hypothetical protein [Oceanicola sp. S124]|uniref:hypothetical protein n=1 Tax=Oceanicola sp. S124 TaxID=1042378 RepID=UPI0002559C84|nr:hypothetical protein [Oceanicola sp. S124]
MHSDHPTIGVFKLDEPLILRPLPNGGWVISQRSADMSIMGRELGAYSTTREMLNALSFALVLDGPEDVNKAAETT